MEALDSLIDDLKPNSDPKVGVGQGCIRLINVCRCVLYVCMTFAHGYIVDNQLVRKNVDKQ